MNHKELLLDVSALEAYLTRKGILNETGHIRVEFENPMKVFAQDPTLPLAGDIEPKDRSVMPEEDMQIGLATGCMESGNLEGEICYIPTDLHAFYTQHPQYRPKFIAIGSLIQRGKTIEGIKIKWIETRVGG